MYVSVGLKFECFVNIAFGANDLLPVHTYVFIFATLNEKSVCVFGNDQLMS